MSSIDLTLRDFVESNWQEVISTATKHEYLAYQQLLGAKARELSGSEGNSRHIQVYQLLSGIYSMYLDLGLPDQPFKPALVWGNTRSMILDDITESELNVLAELAPTIEDAEAKARICDILWVRQRNHRMAMDAVESYLESATTLEDPDMWPPCVQRIERAMGIAMYLGPKSQSWKSVIAHIETVLDRYDGTDPLFLSGNLMELLIKRRVGNPAKYSPLAEKKALAAEASSNWHLARHYWIIKSRWERLAENEELERDALVRSAETYVKEAEETIADGNPNFSVASTHIQSAIDSYRRIGGHQPRVDELHRLLLEYQEKSVSELKPISFSFDPTEEQERARNFVRGKSLKDALQALAMMHNTKKDDVEKRVIEEAKQFPLQHLITGVAVNEHGKVVHRKPGMMSDDPEERNAALRAEILQETAMNHQLSVITFIDPARQQILSEHYVRESDFFDLAHGSAFVPKGREGIFARGLYAGFTGDFLVSAHLLIPQIENSIRYVLQQRQVITSYLNAEGIQDEKDINSMLYIPELKEVLGEDMLFDLQCVLVERVGSNMRNSLAHGLLDDEDFSGMLPEYVWWITLKLCFIGWLSMIKGQKSVKDTSTT